MVNLHLYSGTLGWLLGEVPFRDQITLGWLLGEVGVLQIF